MTRRTQKSKLENRPTVRVAAYLRQSVSDHLEFGSLDAQLDAITAFVESQRCKGWALLPDHYRDDGQSGGTLQRPALQRLLHSIQNGEVDVVAVHRIDRLSRSIHGFVELSALLNRHGVALVSVTQSFDSGTAMGELVLNILVSFGQFERDMIRERTRDKMRASRRRGLFTGGPPILGYDVVEKRLVVNQPEAELVREIFALYQSLRSLRGVAEQLNAQGRTTKTYTSRNGRRHGGRAWDKVAVRYIVKNATYAGRVRFEDELYEGQHDAIIDPQTWDAVQGMLAQGTRNRRSSHTQTAVLLAGLARCGRCGAALTPTHTKRGTRRYTYYACLTAQKQGAKACPGSRIACADLEQVVVDQLKRIGRDPELIRKVAEEARRAKREREPDLISEIRALDRDKERISRERENLLAAIANGGGAGVASLTQHLGELDEQLQQLGHRAGQVRADLVALEQDTIDEGDLRQALEAFEPVWEELFPRERRRVLQLLVEEVTYDGQSGDVEIRFRKTGLKSLSGMKKKRRRA